MFFCYCLLLFPHSSCLSVNKLDSDYFLSVVNALTLVKPYLFINFVNVGNVITGIGTLMINFIMSYGYLKSASTQMMIYSLKLMNWNFPLL